jgi:hypothetical protein
MHWSTIEVAHCIHIIIIIFYFFSIDFLSEDYRGPTSSGFFKWVPDETGELRPVTRMKEKNLERNPNYEKFYSEQDFKNLK